MVSREFIHSIIHSHHTIAVHMKGEKRLDGLSHLIYVIYNLVLDEKEEAELIMNSINRVKTYGLLRVKAVLTSEVDLSIQDKEPREYTIDTAEIISYEL